MGGTRRLFTPAGDSPPNPAKSTGARADRRRPAARPGEAAARKAGSPRPARRAYSSRWKAFSQSAESAGLSATRSSASIARAYSATSSCLSM